MKPVRTSPGERYTTHDGSNFFPPRQRGSIDDPLTDASRSRARRLLAQDMSKRNGDRVENYSGTITRFGLDVGFTAGGIMTWTVLARTSAHRRGALAGHYVGVSGEISLGPGVGAKALIGGSRRTTVLQPVSVVGKIGANLALGVTGLTLRFEN
jgi:Protein of unknown function (DUF992)